MAQEAPSGFNILWFYYSKEATQEVILEPCLVHTPMEFPPRSSLLTPHEGIQLLEIAKEHLHSAYSSNRLHIDIPLPEPSAALQIPVGIWRKNEPSPVTQPGLSDTSKSAACFSGIRLEELETNITWSCMFLQLKIPCSSNWHFVYLDKPDFCDNISYKEILKGCWNIAETATGYWRFSMRDSVCTVDLQLLLKYKS